jgi:hypothetical protein
MNKKLIIGMTIVVALIAIFLGWFYLLKEGGSNNEQTATTTTSGSPFGSGENLDSSQNSSTNPLSGNGTGAAAQEMYDSSGKPISNLYRLSKEPVAGAVAINRNGQTIIRYVERATGHIIEVNPATLETKAITNQTIPKIYSAKFRPDGSAVLYRSLKDGSDVVENTSLTLTLPKATSTDGIYGVSAAALRGDIGSVTVIGSTLYYVLKDSKNISSSNFTGSQIKTLFSSGFSEWTLTPAGNNLVIFTKPTASAVGYAYTLSVNGGTPTKILGPLLGLVVLPNSSGSRILYSYTDNGLAKTKVNNSQGNTISEISPATIAEKCVWSTKNQDRLICASPANNIGNYEPDNWYQGTTSFSDRIWLFNTANQVAQILVEPKIAFNIDLDAIEPKLSINEDYLYFINKRDLTLWVLKLEKF